MRGQVATDDRDEAPNAAAPQIVITGFGTLGSDTGRPRTFNNRRTQASDTLSMTRGRHQIAIGAAIADDPERQKPASGEGARDEGHAEAGGVGHEKAVAREQARRAHLAQAGGAMRLGAHGQECEGEGRTGEVAESPAARVGHEEGLVERAEGGAAEALVLHGLDDVVFGGGQFVGVQHEQRALRQRGGRELVFDELRAAERARVFHAKAGERSLHGIEGAVERGERPRSVDRVEAPGLLPG